MGRKNKVTIRQVSVNKVPVELYKILKFEGLLPSGAESKAAVAEGLVKVNGAVETQKRKKILHDDVIEIGDIRLHIVLDEVGTT